MEKDKLLSLLEDKNEFVVTIDDNVENHKNNGKSLKIVKNREKQ